MDTIGTCPLGHECQKAVDGRVEQCNWFIKMKGSNPQDGSEIDEYRCAVAWMPLLSVAHTQTAAQTNASVQSLRNETVARQELAIKAVKDAQVITVK